MLACSSAHSWTPLFSPRALTHLGRLSSNWLVARAPACPNPHAPALMGQQQHHSAAHPRPRPEPLPCGTPLASRNSACVGPRRVADALAPHISRVPYLRITWERHRRCAQAREPRFTHAYKGRASVHFTPFTLGGAATDAANPSAQPP